MAFMQYDTMLLLKMYFFASIVQVLYIYGILFLLYF